MPPGPVAGPLRFGGSEIIVVQLQSLIHRFLVEYLRVNEKDCHGR